MRVAPSPPYASCPHQAERMCRVALENPPAALDRQRDLTTGILATNLTLSADRHFATNARSRPCAPFPAGSGRFSDGERAVSVPLTTDRLIFPSRFVPFSQSGLTPPGAVTPSR